MPRRPLPVASRAATPRAFSATALVVASVLGACNEAEVVQCVGVACAGDHQADPCLLDHGGCDDRTTCTVSSGQVVCGACPTGFSGTGKAGCTDVDECATDNGGCDPLTRCANTVGDRTCSGCPNGYSGTGAAGCTDIDECATDNGRCDPLTACTNTVGGRTCSACPAGYTGNGSGVCLDINECATANGGCDAHAPCTNTPGSHTCGACPEGFTGTGATACTDVDECATNHGGCDARVTCTNTPGGHSCGACPEGFAGSGTTTCTDIDECDTDNGGCDAATICTNTDGGRTCSACPSGYAGTGATGCVDTDECATNHGGCDPLSPCVNTPGGRTCGACPSGYTGTGLTQCVDINECTTVPNGGCDAKTTCANVGGGRTCSACPSGYRGTGATACVDIDECKSANGGCDPLTQCTNTAGARDCGACPAGYAGNGVAGCVDVDECATQNGGCDPLAICVNTPGGRHCGHCRPGYIEAGGGSCVDANECLTNNGGCGAPQYATCTNRIGAARICTDVDECAVNHGGCPVGISTCVNHDAAPPTCADVDECKTKNGGCGLPAMYTCINAVGGPPSCDPVDPCATQNGGCDVNATCAMTGPGMRACECKAGFKGNGTTCTEVDICDGNADCGIHATCAKTGVGAYRCDCNPGFTAEGDACVLVCGLNTQALAGTLRDTDGRLIGSNGHYLNLILKAHNADGDNTANVTPSGDIAFCVPPGPIEVRLADPSNGFFSRNDQPNPRIPWLIESMSAPEQVLTWTAEDGSLDLTLPAVLPVVVHVTSGGAPLAGARVDSQTVLTSLPFTLRAATETVTTADFRPGTAVTDADGNATLMVWPTDGQTFSITASTIVHDVTLAKTVSGVATEAGTVEIALPDPPELLTGTFSDTNGDPIPSNGHYVNLILKAYNDNGKSQSNVDTAGNFSFYVPSGAVHVQLADPSNGFFSRSDLPNPHIPVQIESMETEVPWNPADGSLDLVLPAVIPITVHVVSGGQPVAGVSVGSFDSLTSTPFLLHPDSGLMATAGFRPGADPRNSNAPVTDANGNATLLVWPTDGQTFTVAARVTVQGVALTGTLSEVPTEEGTVTVTLPDPPQLLTGTLKDEDGDPIPSNGHYLNLMLRAFNADGVATSNVDTAGNFSFYVPAGEVSLWLREDSQGMFSRNDVPNPRIPGLIESFYGLTIPWTSADGPLALTLPSVVAITVHVTTNGEPVEGAVVSSQNVLTSLPFTLCAAKGIVTTADFRPWITKTDAQGYATLMVWETDGEVFDIDATAMFSGVAIHGTGIDVPADGAEHTVEIVLVQ